MNLLRNHYAFMGDLHASIRAARLVWIRCAWMTPMKVT